MAKQIDRTKQVNHLEGVEVEGFRLWWQQLRPHTLTASFVPVAAGTVIALVETGSFRPLLFLAMLLASMLIQSATNLFNEYYDYKRGLDNPESVGIGGGIVRGGIAPKTILNVALSFFGIALLLGVFICMQTSWLIAIVGLFSMLVGYLYTGGPYPIAYTPFGELVSGFFMGPIIVLIAYFIQSGTLSNHAFLISIPIGIIIGAILMANNIRDLDGDKENGRHTLAILLGRKNAIVVLGWMLGASYLWMISLVVSDVVTPWSLLVLLSIPKGISAVRGFVGKSVPIEMYPAMKATGITNTLFGLLLVIGLVIDYFI